MIRYKVIWTRDPDSQSTNLKNTEHIKGAVIYNTKYDNNDSYGTAVVEQLLILPPPILLPSALSKPITMNIMKAS